MKRLASSFARWLIVFASGLIAAVAASATKPNIVLIITDDQSYGDLGVTENPVAKTPHVERLAAKRAALPHRPWDQPHRRVAHGRRPLDAARKGRKPTAADISAIAP